MSGYPIFRHHPPHFNACLTQVPRFCLVPVVLVSLFSFLRIVNGIARVVVVDYCVVQLYISTLFDVCFSFLGIQTQVTDPCPSSVVAGTGKYIFYQPILSVENYYFILNTENAAYSV